jgi:hypothetical protein
VHFTFNVACAVNFARMCSRGLARYTTTNLSCLPSSATSIQGCGKAVGPFRCLGPEASIFVLGSRCTDRSESVRM